jgi:L-histidine N-alpha-methyltransferase
VAQFGYEAIYNHDAGRVEMFLVSQIRQNVRVRGEIFALSKGERIHTENSHKYTIDEFRGFAHKAGWNSTSVWTDDNRLFSVHECVIAA